MHDAVSLELKGVPSACIVTSGFVGQVAYQAEILGVASCPAVYVQHPVSNATVEEMNKKTEQSYELCLQSLRSGPAPFPPWMRGEAEVKG